MGEWLETRTPLWRYDTSCPTLPAWDFPLARGETQQRAMLHLATNQEPRISQAAELVTSLLSGTWTPNDSLPTHRSSLFHGPASTYQEAEAEAAAGFPRLHAMPAHEEAEAAAGPSHPADRRGKGSERSGSIRRNGDLVAPERRVWHSRFVVRKSEGLIPDTSVNHGGASAVSSRTRRPTSK